MSYTTNQAGRQVPAEINGERVIPLDRKSVV